MDARQESSIDGRLSQLIDDACDSYRVGEDRKDAMRAFFESRFQSYTTGGTGKGVGNALAALERDIEDRLLVQEVLGRAVCPKSRAFQWRRLVLLVVLTLVAYDLNAIGRFCSFAFSVTGPGNADRLDRETEVARGRDVLRIPRLVIFDRNQRNKLFHWGIIAEAMPLW